MIPLLNVALERLPSDQRGRERPWRQKEAEPVGEHGRAPGQTQQRRALDRRDEVGVCASGPVVHDGLEVDLVDVFRAVRLLVHVVTDEVRIGADAEGIRVQRVELEFEGPVGGERFAGASGASGRTGTPRSRGTPASRGPARPAVRDCRRARDWPAPRPRGRSAPASRSCGDRATGLRRSRCRGRPR